METILEYSGGQIRAGLASSEKILTDGVNFSVAEGESLALIGETGSGKTLIAQSIMGVLPDNVRMTGGSVRMRGRLLPSGRRMRSLLGTDIVYIPQNGHEFLDPSRKIRNHMYDSLKKMGVPPGDRMKTACAKLEEAGFSDPGSVLEKYPFQLSGGMAQRVTIALALCSEAGLIIADEPTNGLDQAAKERFIGLIRGLFPKAAKLVITHDISVASMCDRVLVLCGGRMLETGDAREVLAEPRQPYTKALLGALVENGMRETPFLRGETGLCPFYRRCGLAGERCLKEMTRRVSGGREWWCCAQ